MEQAARAVEQKSPNAVRPLRLEVTPRILYTMTR
jgi:hypothetical protein